MAQTEVEVDLASLQKEVQKLHADIQLFKKNPGLWHVFCYYMKGKNHRIQDVEDLFDDAEKFLNNLLGKKK